MKTILSKTVLFVCLGLTIILSACGASAPAATPTVAASATPVNTSTPTLAPTATKMPTWTPRPTITPNVVATQQYDEFALLVQKYHDAGQISTTEGNYITLADFRDELAYKLSYDWSTKGAPAKNFIVRSDLEWSNATKTANLSGCGFVFRLQSNKDHYLIILDAFQGVKLASKTDRGTYSMGPPSNGEKKKADFGANPYRATFTLIVNELKSYVYVNDIYYGEYKLLDYRITDSGYLAGAVLSATNTGYGTRCAMTNTRVWVIDS